MSSALEIFTVLIFVNILFFGLTNLVLMRKYNKASVKKGARQLEELLNILNYTIENEIMFRLKIENELKRNKKILTDFSEELTIMSKNVLGALNKYFLEELNYYYNESYILKYIVKTIEIAIIKYMDQTKLTTK